MLYMNTGANIPAGTLLLDVEQAAKALHKTLSLDSLPPIT
jgi:hypothetical protein